MQTKKETHCLSHLDKRNGKKSLGISLRLFCHANVDSVETNAVIIHVTANPFQVKTKTTLSEINNSFADSSQEVVCSVLILSLIATFPNVPLPFQVCSTQFRSLYRKLKFKFPLNAAQFNRNQIYSNMFQFSQIKYRQFQYNCNLI